MGIFDIYLVEAILNGLFFGGVLALLALGLNLIFGVVDVIWLCFAELVMVGMYAIYGSYVLLGFPLPLAALFGIAVTTLCGVTLHRFVILPILKSAPINQLLATGGVLFFLQSFATLTFGNEYLNIGLRMPVLQVFGMYIQVSRLIAFCVAAIGVVALVIFLNRTYIGTAIRAVSQDREIMALMGVDPLRIYMITSAIAAMVAGVGACILLLQFDVHPAVGLSFGPLTFMVCVLGGLGNLYGGFLAAFILAQLITLGGFFFTSEWGYVAAFGFFIVAMILRPQGLMGERA